MGLLSRLLGRKGAAGDEYYGATNTPAPASPHHVPTPENITILQGFEWYCPPDHKHWRRIQRNLSTYKSIGIDNIWIPPACKAGNPKGNGYDIYDLYDLGEFDQKGSVATKWGTKQELAEMIHEARGMGIGVFFDAVLNHKAAADFTEPCYAIEVDPKDRLKEIGRPKEIEGWFGFNFPGRKLKYSAVEYHAHHFSGTDWNHRTQENGVFRIVGQDKPGWAPDVDPELGNYDYLMFADVDYSNAEVRQDVLHWAEWLGKELPISGIRLDAVKHYSESFQRELIRHLKSTVGRDWFFVGEYWKFKLDGLREYLARMDHQIHLFDSALVYRLSDISKVDKADMRLVFDKTLVSTEPKNAVTFVMNHDTQPKQALEAIITPWFKPLAYALILLRAAGLPCVFWGDLYGIRSSEELHSGTLSPPSCNGRLPALVLIRKLFAYGPEVDYFNKPNCIGWTRLGTHDRPTGLAVVLSNGFPDKKKMYVGKNCIGQCWVDVLGFVKKDVIIDKRGLGEFWAPPKGLSVWVEKEAWESVKGRCSNFNTRVYEEC